MSDKTGWENFLKIVKDIKLPVIISVDLPISGEPKFGGVFGRLKKFFDNKRRKGKK